MTEKERQPPDLGDQLVEGPEAEERARREEEERDERDSAGTGPSRWRSSPCAKSCIRLSIRIAGMKTSCARRPVSDAHPGDRHLRARPDLLERVHEPVVLGVVAALQVGLQRDVVVAVLEETLRRQAVVRHVVVAVGDPVEAEPQRRPADVDRGRRARSYRKGASLRERQRRAGARRGPRPRPTRRASVVHGPAVRTGMPQTLRRVMTTRSSERPTVGATNQLQRTPIRGLKRLTTAWPRTAR